MTEAFSSDQTTETPSAPVTFPPAASEATTPVPSSGGVMKYTRKPAEPEIVDAFQYIAPDGATEAGNLPDIAGLPGVTLITQQPSWNPVGGQTAIHVNDVMVLPGQFVVITAGGAVEAYDEDAFATLFDSK